MSDLPQIFYIDPDDWKALIKAGEEMKATQQVIDSFVERASTRIEGSNRMARAIWRRIKETNPNIDLDNINYMPHEHDAGVLVPVSMKLPIK